MWVEWYTSLRAIYKWHWRIHTQVLVYLKWTYRYGGKLDFLKTCIIKMKSFLKLSKCGSYERSFWCQKSKYTKLKFFLRTIINPLWYILIFILSIYRHCSYWQIIHDYEQVLNCWKAWIQSFYLLLFCWATWLLRMCIYFSS